MLVIYACSNVKYAFASLNIPQFLAQDIQKLKTTPFVNQGIRGQETYMYIEVPFFVGALPLFKCFRGLRLQEMDLLSLYVN